MPAGGDPRWSPCATQLLGKEENMEDDHIPHTKPVLAKVKEKPGNAIYSKQEEAQ